MTEYIERESAIEAFYTATADGDKADWCVGVIQSIPAADVAPVRHGRWIDMGDFISCSVCNATRLEEFESYYGKTKRLAVRTKYCPNCGAKMDGGET